MGFNYRILEAQEAEPVSLTCILAKKLQRRTFFNESANQKQDLSGGLVFLALGYGETSMDALH